MKELRYKIYEVPEGEPVTLDEAKKQSRITISEDNGYVTGLIKAAREQIEMHTRRQLLTATYDLFLDKFPSVGDAVNPIIYRKINPELIRIPKPPLQEISYIKYYDEAGVLQTLDEEDYQVDTTEEPGRVVPAPETNWPQTQLDRINAVQIRFVAGFGDEASDVPECYKQAIKFYTDHWYNERAPVVVGSIASVIPETVQRILNGISLYEL